MTCTYVDICEGCGEERRIKARGLCTRCYNNDWNLNHRWQVNVSNQRWRINNPVKLRESRRKRRHDPVKRKAQVMVANAIRDGKLIRESCENCGGEPTQAHHDDYSKPLNIRWLCRDCHTEEHYGG